MYLKLHAVHCFENVSFRIENSDLRLINSYSMSFPNMAVIFHYIKLRRHKIFYDCFYFSTFNQNNRKLDNRA